MNKAKKVFNFIAKRWFITITCFCFGMFIGIDRTFANQTLINGGGGTVSGSIVGINGVLADSKVAKFVRIPVGVVSGPDDGGDTVSKAIAHFKVGNVTAFCLTPSISEAFDLLYTNVQTTNSNPPELGTVGRASRAFGYYYANAAGNESAVYAVAQWYVWYGRIPDSKSLKSLGISQEKASLVMTANKDSWAYSIWYPICNNGQTMIAWQNAGEKASESNISCGSTSSCTPTCKNNCCGKGACDPDTNQCSNCTPTVENNCCGQGESNPICATCYKKPTVNVANYCATTGTYEDITDLNCVKGQDQFYDSSAYTGDATAEYGYNYCRWYCVENDTTYHPGDYDYVFYAGRYFTIGESVQDNVWGPITVYGKRTCYSYYSTDNSNNSKTFVQGVNWTKFKKDIASLNTQIESAYNSYKNELAYSHAYDDSMSKTYSANEMSCKHEECLEYNIVKGTCHHVNGGSCTSAYWNSDSDYCWCDDDTQGSCKNLHVWYTIKYQASSTFTTNGALIGSYSRNVGSSCDAPGGSSVSSKQSYLNSLISKRQTLINAMQDCANADNIYVLNPTITFKYSDATFKYSTTDGDITMATDGNTDKITPTAKTLGSSGSYNYLNCDNQQDYDRCYYETKYMDNVTNGADSNPTTYYTITENYLNYYLPDSEYKETSKTDGSAFKESGDANTIQNNSGAMLPLNYKLEAGQYKISYTYGHIGNRNKYNDGYFDYMINTGVNGTKAKVESGQEYIIGSGDDMYEYACEVTITNEILKSNCVQDCESKYGRGTGGYTSCVSTTCCGDLKSSTADCKLGGIDVIYRTIQLQVDSNNSVAKTENLSDQDVSFPSYNANGRVPGANWDTTDHYYDVNGNIADHNTHIASGDVTAYITYNRNVYGKAVYDKTPLYTITLTPSNILQIRQYNKEETANNNGGYADFNNSMTCDKNGRNCVSKFIHGTVNSYTFSVYFDAANSSCLNVSVENANSTFDACRY